MKQHKLWLSMLAAVLTFGSMNSCKKDNIIEKTGKCPEVIATNPTNLQTGVDKSQAVTVTFNTKMSIPSINQSGFQLTGASLVDGDITFDDATNTMTFTPASPLAENTTYTGVVKTSVKEQRGNALQQDYVWTFSTGSVVKPVVISTDPVSNATGVVLNKMIKAVFSKPMDPSTITSGTFLLKQGTSVITGSVTYSGSTATFNPGVSLIANTLYSASITTSAKDLSGVAIATDYNWSFTTGSTVAPTVISTNPLNNATGVPLNQVVQATFSEVMDPSTINSTSFKLNQGANIISGSVTYSGSTASFSPSTNLTQGLVYTATITVDASNVSGTFLANDYVWSFTAVNSTAFTPVVNLNSAADFGILAGVGISNNAGFSEIYDLNVGISPGVRTSITGFPPAIIVNGSMFASDDIAPAGVAAMLNQAKMDLTQAYLQAEGASNPAPATVSGDLGGLTLTPGIYKSTSTLLIQSGDLTLDGQGDPNASWIFQVASAFTTVGGAGGSIILTGGAQAKNIFWQTGSSATIGDFTTFKGNVLALTSITMNSGAVAQGRMLAQNGSVIMTNTNIITKP